MVCVIIAVIYDVTITARRHRSVSHLHVIDLPQPDQLTWMHVQALDTLTLWGPWEKGMLIEMTHATCRPLMEVSVAVAVPLASWGTAAATRVPRLRIGERPREWTRG